MSSFDYHHNILKGLMSWTTEEEKRFLFSIVESIRGSVLEIGVGCGYNLCLIALVLHDLGRQFPIWGIDSFDRKTATWSNPRYQTLGGYDTEVDLYTFVQDQIQSIPHTDSVVLIPSDSSSVGRSWVSTLDLLIIDGGHTYEAVKSDLHLFSRHVNSKGGKILLHDYRGSHPGCTNAIDEFLLIRKGEWLTVSCAGLYLLIQRR